MLDGAAKKLIDPWLTRSGHALARLGVTADGVTLAALALGIIAAAMIVQGWFAAALCLVLLSRLCDGLDGAVARAGRSTDFGGYLDIVLDFAFYGMIPLAFVLYDPIANGLAGAALIFSFYVNGASFLAYAVMAEKRRMTDDELRGSKSFYFTTGLAEASETLGVFVLMCLWPAGFAIVAALFALVCLYTALSRVMLARAAFRT